MAHQVGTVVNRWTKEEIDHLALLRDTGADVATMATSLRRTEMAVRQKLYQISEAGTQAKPSISIDDLAIDNYERVSAQLDALEERRGVLLSEKSKAMKVLVALGLEDEKHMCAKCGQEFVRKGDLTAHVNREHPTTVHVGEGVVSQ